MTWKCGPFPKYSSMVCWRDLGFSEEKGPLAQSESRVGLFPVDCASSFSKRTMILSVLLKQG